MHGAQGSRFGMFAYTVAVVGLFRTTMLVVKMRNDKMHSAARSVARRIRPGGLNYSVVNVEAE